MNVWKLIQLAAIALYFSFGGPSSQVRRDSSFRSSLQKCFSQAEGRGMKHQWPSAHHITKFETELVFRKNKYIWITMLSSEGIKLIPWRYVVSASWSSQRHLACSLYTRHLPKKSLRLSLGTYKVSTSFLPLAQKKTPPSYMACNPNVKFQRDITNVGLGLWPARSKGPSALQGGEKQADDCTKSVLPQGLRHHASIAVALGTPGVFCLLLLSPGAPHREAELYGAAGLIAWKAKSCIFSKRKAPFDLW